MDRFSTEPGATMFRTGDLVRAVNERELEFMGRLDYQVKLRGYRIELAEIETALRSHPAVKDAATILREDIPGEPRLVAYVTLAQGNPVKASELKEHTGRSLPEYMLPARIVIMDALPLTVSGKIDRRSLPLPESIAGVASSRPTPANEAPENELEGKLLEVFVNSERALAGCDRQLFRLLGYSLLTARLFSQIYRTIGRKLPISLLFDAPTPRGLAQLMQKDEPLPIVVPIRKEGRAAPLFVIHSYLIYEVLRRAIEEDRPIFGVRELDDEPVSTLENVLPSMRRRSRGRVRRSVSLAGWCLAGSLTVEVAPVLREQGRIVARVAAPRFREARRQASERKPRQSAQGPAQDIFEFSFRSDAGFDWQERIPYLSNHSRHRWEETLESFTVRGRGLLRWLHRNLGFALPEAMRTRLVRLGTDQSRPSFVQRYPGKIVLFCASEVVRVSGTEPSLGWDEVAKTG